MSCPVLFHRHRPRQWRPRWFDGWCGAGRAVAAGRDKQKRYVFSGSVLRALCPAVGIGGRVVRFVLAASPRYRSGRSIAAMFIVGGLWRPAEEELLAAHRCLRYIYRVRMDPDRAGVLSFHGSTLHRAGQALDPRRRREVSDPNYRTVPGPIGQVMRCCSAARQRQKLGVGGLGDGLLARVCTARPNMDLLEIDPMVERIGADPSLSTYISDCGRGP